MKKTFMILWSIILSSCTYTPVNLGHNYYYNDECHHILGDSFDIADKVVCYNFDNQYIIAKQRPTYSYDSIYDYPKGFKTEDYLLGIDTTYYWIIEKSSDKVFGPLLYDAYLSIKDSLHINLKLSE